MSHFRKITGLIGEALLRFSVSKKQRFIIDPEIEKAFWARVEKTDSCWLWTGAVRKDGGGSFGIGRRGSRKLYSANRVSWQLAHGEIDDTVKIFPLSCHNKRCVNPAHLYAGSAVDCAQYLASYRGKPNRASGEKNGSSKLTEKQVIEIRRLYRLRRLTQRELAKRFSVDRNTIGFILRGETWRLA